MSWPVRRLLDLGCRKRKIATSTGAAMFRFATVVQRCGLVLAILLAVAPISSAQQAPLVGIEPIRGSLDQIEAATRRALRARALADLSQRLPPLREELRDKAAQLEPRPADLH